MGVGVVLGQKRGRCLGELARRVALRWRFPRWYAAGVADGGESARVGVKRERHWGWRGCL